MALDLEPMMVLSQKLTGGYHLSAQLQALLGRPMDSRGQEEAMAVSQKLSRVFMEAMSVLRHANSNGVDVLRMAPEIMTGNSIGFRTDTKDKRIRYTELLTAFHLHTLVNSLVSIFLVRYVVCFD